MSGDSSTFSVRLPNDLRTEVDQFATLTKRSRSFVVKEAVEAYMQEQRDYLAAIDEAIEEADKGVFISGDAVDRWLASWGTDNVLPMPKPDIFPDDSK
ncbi:MAG: CopG family transcriptional regulator [Pseudaminobacter sp.]|nr:CopG family transcriptional regulator [Pseudaminobacter sp.]